MPSLRFGIIFQISRNLTFYSSVAHKLSTCYILTQEDVLSRDALVLILQCLCMTCLNFWCLLVVFSISSALQQRTQCNSTSGSRVGGCTHISPYLWWGREIVFIFLVHPGVKREVFEGSQEKYDSKITGYQAPRSNG